ncbi:MAG TPA: 5'-nucleotidase C-terminal domain-containing protein [Victivallales bacterium]|nr:5'-nucleotidase C-terminal domain-containing protein [Victivallales bacterium]
MMRRALIILYFFFSFHVFSGEKSLFILNSTDIHAKLEDSADESGRIPNILRLSGLIRNRRSEIGEANVISIDCGDILQGSFAGMFSRGEISSEFLRRNSYDVWVPGNHDFDFGFERFEELSGKIPRTAILALNIQGKGILAWKMFQKNGLKIAVIGASLSYLDSFNMKMTGDFRIEGKLDSIIPEIMRESPNAIIMAIHQGIYSPKERGGADLAKIASRYPQINLFLGGHSHEDNPGRKIGRASWFVQAGCHAKTLAEIEMLFDDSNGKLLDISSRMLDVTIESKKDMELLSSVKGMIDDSGKCASEIVGETLHRIPNVDEGVIDCEIRELISASMCAASGAEIAFSGCGTGIAGFEGKIRKGDLFRLLPYEDRICTLNLSPDQFKEIISEQTRKFDPRHFYMPWGIFCDYNEDKGEYTLKMQSGQQWIEGEKTVAFSSFALSGAGGRFPALANIAKNPQSSFSDTGINLRDAVGAFIQNKSPLSIKTRLWIDKSVIKTP